MARPSSPVDETLRSVRISLPEADPHSAIIRAWLVAARESGTDISGALRPILADHIVRAGTRDAAADALVDRIDQLLQTRVPELLARYGASGGTGAAGGPPPALPSLNAEEQALVDTLLAQFG